MNPKQRRFQLDCGSPDPANSLPPSVPLSTARVILHHLHAVLCMLLASSAPPVAAFQHQAAPACGAIRWQAALSPSAAWWALCGLWVARRHGEGPLQGAISLPGSPRPAPSEAPVPLTRWRWHPPALPSATHVPSSPGQGRQSPVMCCELQAPAPVSYLYSPVCCSMAVPPWGWGGSLLWRVGQPWHRPQLPTLGHPASPLASALEQASCQERGPWG